MDLSALGLEGIGVKLGFSIVDSSSDFKDFSHKLAKISKPTLGDFRVAVGMIGTPSADKILRADQNATIDPPSESFPIRAYLSVERNRPIYIGEHFDSRTQTVGVDTVPGSVEIEDIGHVSEEDAVKYNALFDALADRVSLRLNLGGQNTEHVLSRPSDNSPHAKHRFLIADLGYVPLSHFRYYEDGNGFTDMTFAAGAEAFKKHLSTGKTSGDGSQEAAETEARIEERDIRVNSVKSPATLSVV